jgi:putative nucleotidyltransferase with HDIG domain
MASLVYPGALHTRFDHTLGVAHVAGQMADELELDADEMRVVRRAALLHDVGHEPFSHVSEYALERFADREALPEDHRQENRINTSRSTRPYRGTIMPRGLGI